jgi:hypothetical protein
MPTFVALYSDAGGPPRGFVCCVDPEKCRKVVRTRKGINLHLWRKHKVRAQLEMDLAMDRKEDFTWMDS